MAIRIERMENEEFVKKVYRSSVEGPNRRGRPLGRWEETSRWVSVEVSEETSGCVRVGWVNERMGG